MNTFTNPGPCKPDAVGFSSLLGVTSLRDSEVGNNYGKTESPVDECYSVTV